MVLGDVVISFQPLLNGPIVIAFVKFHGGVFVPDPFHYGSQINLAVQLVPCVSDGFPLKFCMREQRVHHGSCHPHVSKIAMRADIPYAQGVFQSCAFFSQCNNPCNRSLNRGNQERTKVHFIQLPLAKKWDVRTQIIACLNQKFPRGVVLGLNGVHHNGRFVHMPILTLINVRCVHYYGEFSAMNAVNVENEKMRSMNVAPRTLMSK